MSDMAFSGGLAKSGRSWYDSIKETAKKIYNRGKAAYEVLKPFAPMILELFSLL